MNIKIYISDDGYGHVVRQRAIIEELLKDDNRITIQTKGHIEVARSFFKGRINYIERFNNIGTVKSSGSLDVEATRSLMQNYFFNYADTIICENKELENYDFVISDLVPEAIAAAKLCNKKVFAVCHHTWDWFFQKIFGTTKFGALIEENLMKADAIFFPPFTPDEILEKYKDIAVNIPFIVYPFEDISYPLLRNRMNVLVLDSGTKVLADIIEKNKRNFKKMSEFNFVTDCDVNKVHNLIPKFDLVISRAGFNTISDCMAAETPILVINEKNNPEVAHNISRLFELNLCGIMSVNDYESNFISVFRNFINHKYDEIKQNTKKHIFKYDGAKKVAEEVTRRCMQ